MFVRLPDEARAFIVSVLVGVKPAADFKIESELSGGAKASMTRLGLRDGSTQDDD